MHAIFHSTRLRLVLLALLVTLLFHQVGQVVHAEENAGDTYDWSDDRWQPADYDWSDDRWQPADYDWSDE